MDCKTFSWSCLAVFSFTLASIGADAQLPKNPDFDKRRAALLRAPVLEGSRAVAAERLGASMEGVQIDLDDVTGSPKFIYNRYGFLSLPSSAREMVPRPIGVEPEQIDDDPHEQITAFLDEHADLFGHDANILEGAKKTRDYVTEHSGMRTVVWQQELDGIPIFQAMLYGHVTKHGELVSLCSQFIPEPVKAAEKGTPNRGITLAVPPVSPLQALRTAATNIGEVLRAEEIIAVDYPKEQPDREQRFQAASLLNDATTALVWLPMDRTSMRLCWRVILTGKTSGELYETLIDAVNGEPQVRLCRTSYFQQASFRVFDKDSPTPLSPGWSSPNPPLPAQPAFRAQVDKLNVTSTASPNGWLQDGRTDTIGNNVDAHLDIKNVEPLYGLPIAIPAEARPSGTLVGNQLRFWFTTDLSQPPKPPAPQEPNPASNNQKAAVVNAFYWCNWMHDKLYDLGFTEGAGNFQFDNFGRGGVGNDPVLVDVQDGSDVGLRNQNRMGVDPRGDGFPPRLQLHLFNGPTNLSPAELERDAALAAEVILHEYTHGMNARLISQGAGQFGFGLDEGFADFFSLACLSEVTDNPALTYPLSSYVARNWQVTPDAPRVQANYYYGLLLYPYSTLKAYNPLTFKDVDPAQSAAHTGSSTYSGDPNNEYTKVVKAQQVWGVTLWEMRARLVTNHGFPAGNDLAMRLVVDAMKLMPPKPNFLQARDALLLADRVYNNGNNQTAIWQAFATRGMGAKARAGAGQDLEVVESFEIPSGATWTFTTGQAIYGSPAIGADGTIYIGSNDGKLYAIRPDGQKLWEYYEAATYPAFNSPPMVGPDGTIYARRRDGYLYAINPNGVRKWRTFVSYDSYVAPALGRDGTIYVAGLHDLKAISPQGTILWTFNTGNTIYSSPAIGLDGTIYFGGMDTKVYAVDPTTHQVKSGWPYTTGGYVSSSPAIAPDGTIYIGSHDGKLYALNPNGSKKWDIFLSGSIMDSSPAIGPDGTIYVGSTDNKVYSINPVTHTINEGWPYVTGNSIRCSPAVGLDGTVYVGSDKLYALNADATLRWYQWTGTAIVQSSPGIGRDGMLYIGSVDGKLYGFQTGTDLARTTWPAFRQNAAHTGTEPVTGEFLYVWQCTSTETPPDCEYIIDGSWRDVYDLGKQAYHVIGDAYNYGGYLQVTPTGHLPYVWASSTTQTQALQKVVGTDRIAACWYGINSFAIDVKVLNPQTHTLSLYFLDWQGANIRSQRINLYDAHSGFLLDSQTVGSFSKGAYMFWRINGGVRFEFTKLSGDNAVVSGLFLDAN